MTENLFWNFRRLCFQACIFCLAVTVGQDCPIFAQSVYSYLDENGVRVFTNIPPKNAGAADAPVMKVISTRSGNIKTVNSAKPKVSSRAPQPPKLASPAKNPAKSPPQEIEPIIDRYAAEYQVDPLLVRSIISTESAFNPSAVSPKGARGLMQLMPATAARLGVRNIHDPEENIRGGVKHFRTLMDTFNNDLQLSLAAYNAGENLVARLGRVPNIPETSAYVKTITRKYGKTEMPASPAFAEVRPPPMFRFFDSQGTLHLTNIPPTQRSESGSAGFTLVSAGP